MSRNRRLLAVWLMLVGLTLVGAPAASAYYSGQHWPGDPLAGHPWFVDKRWGNWYSTIRSNPRLYASLRKAANNPMGKTFGSFIADPQKSVGTYIAGAEKAEPGSIVFLNLARMEEGCPATVAPPGFALPDVENWVRGFSAGIGDSSVVVVIETDKLAVITCGTRAGMLRHYAEIDFEVRTLHENNPNAIVYIDAGASDWHSSSVMATRLRRADIAQAHGFIVGASHFDWTYKEDAYGLRISRLLGGVHFVVNTNENGWGPKPRWYEPYYHPGGVPPGEGLGIVPTTKTPNPHIDAYVWSGAPGYSVGNDIGMHSSAYKFWPSLALSLVKYARPKLPK